MRTFKASGILYSDGEKIGTTEYRIDSEYLKTLVDESPRTLPVMNSINVYVPRLGVSNHQWSSEDGIIGHADLEYVDDKGSPHIVANITFNNHYREKYEKILQSEERKQLRLGFYMNNVSKDEEHKTVTHGRIRAIMLSETCLGGYIYKFGWEDITDASKE